jgi:ElaA protein
VADPGTGGHREGGDDGAAAVHAAAFADLDPRTAYLLWQLRVDVFVVEQQCAYRELDGRDPEPSARHVWAEQDGVPVGYLRVLAEPDGSRRIGRVCVAAGARGRGWAARLMQRALSEVGRARCVLDAQAHLAGWYARWGFEAAGEEFVEDGIPHLPMARGAAACT